MRKAYFAAIAFGVIAAPSIQAAQDTVAGNWTVNIENLSMRLVLAQTDTAVTGTLDYPHGAPFKLTGAYKSGTLTFRGDTDSALENFSMHIDAVGTLKADGSLEGTINAHFIERDDAGKVIRTRDQVIMWIAIRISER
jgi:hypothetical protein